MTTNQALLSLLGIILAAVAGFLALRWLERRLDRPGLAHRVIGVFLIAWGAYRLTDGLQLIPVLFILQGIGSIAVFAPLQAANVKAKATE